MLRFVLGVVAVAALHFVATYLVTLGAERLGGSSYILVAKILRFPLSRLWGPHNTLEDRVLLSLGWGLVVYSAFRISARRAEPG